MNIRIIKEAFRGEDSAAKEELLEKLPQMNDGVRSARRGAGTSDQRALKGKAGSAPGKLLQELGVGGIRPNPVPIVACKDAIAGFLSGTKDTELQQLFSSNIRLIKKSNTVGLWIPMKAAAYEAISQNGSYEREFAYWFYSVILAANLTSQIFNGIAIRQLRVDRNNSGYLIYLARKSWNNL